MSMKVLEHLALQGLEELEAAVPDDLLATVWPGVEAGVRPARARIHQAFSEELVPGRSHNWILPTLAAAAVVLLFSTGFLFSELRKAETQGAQLAGQIVDLQEEINENDANAEWIQRTGRLAGNRRSRARALDYVLAGQEGITVAALVELLEKYPADMVLFEASQIDNLLGTPMRPPPELRRLLSAVASALATLGDAQGVRAGELARWLATSGLPQDLMVPKTPLIDLLS
jgi:hypothetical protein